MSVIPAKALEQHIIVLGKTRSGKSSKMRVLVEQLLRDRSPVCIVDPKGDWWGLKSSANGKSAGFPVVIFGGDHADVPINAAVGGQVAELVASGNRPALIDLGGWMVGERTRFFIEFAQAFFKHARGRRTLVIDEVHNFAPQVMRSGSRDVDAAKALHWANRIASEGAGKGITLIAASQRPAKVSKDLVTSCETLIACRVTHPLDRRAAADWIDGCADPTLAKEVLQGLAQMDRTDAWVWSPEIGFGPKQVTWPMFETYDSFAPQAARSTRLKGWAAVDLAEVSGKFERTIKEAAERDPVALQKRVRELQAELNKKVVAATGVPSHTALKQAGREGFAAGARHERKLIVGAISRWQKELKAQIHAALNVALREVRLPPELSIVPGAIPPQVATFIEPQALVRDHRGERIGEVPLKSDTSPTSLGRCERAILQVLAQHPDGCDLNKIALLAGYKKTGGGFLNSLAALRNHSFLLGSNGSVMTITPAGASQGPFQALPSDMVGYWMQHPSFGTCERAIIGRLHALGPCDLASLAEATGYKASGGGFLNALSALRTAGVLIGRNTETMRLAPEIL